MVWRRGFGEEARGGGRRFLVIPLPLSSSCVLRPKNSEARAAIGCALAAVWVFAHQQRGEIVSRAGGGQGRGCTNSVA